MAGTEATKPGAGQLVYPDENNIWRRGVKAAINIVLGSAITFDSNGFATLCTATNYSKATGVGVALEDSDNTSGSDGDTFVQVAMHGTYVFGKSGGVIKPFNLLKVDASSDFVVHGKPADSAGPTNAEVDLARDFYGLAAGRYYGKNKEELDPTDAADTEDIIIGLGL